MRNLLILALALITATSCTKTDVEGSLNDNREIKFNSVKQGNNTGDLGKTFGDAVDGQTFGVYALFNTSTGGALTTYFENMQLSYFDATNWKLDETMYYPLTFEDMYFVAYGNTYVDPTDFVVSDNSGDVKMALSGYSVADQSVITPYENFTVTLNAVKVNTVDDLTNAVILNLTHALAKVNFTAKATNTLGDGSGTGYTVELDEIVVNATDAGDLSIDAVAGTYTWTDAGTATDFDMFDPASPIELTGTATSVSATSLYLIPKQDVTITVNATVYYTTSGGDKVAISNPSGTINVLSTDAIFAINNSVTYNLNINASGTEIIFGTPTIDDWNDPFDGTTDGDVDVPTT